MPSAAPHLMASAVVLDPTGHRTLLVQVGEYRRWGLVGGHVEGGEPLTEAVRRELRGQTGMLTFRVLEPHLGVEQDILDCGHGEVRHVDHVFAVMAEETSDADLTWFDVTDLPDPLVPGVRMHIHAGQKAVAG